MHYVPPYSAVKKFLTVGKSASGDTISGLYENFLDALRLMLAGIDIDEAWYLAQNPDIAQAVKSGTIESAKRHFVEHGYFEGRTPFHIVVDEQWYLLQNPDVAESVRKGTVESAQRHFELDGYREGRFPRASVDPGLARRSEQLLQLVPSMRSLDSPGSQNNVDRPLRLVPSVSSGLRDAATPVRSAARSATAR